MSTNFDLGESHYQRFLGARATVVARLRKLADDIEQVPENDHKGNRREPSAMLGQVTHMLLWGVATLGLDNMAQWADSVYEIRTYDAQEAIKAARATPFATQCPATIDDPHRDCVLESGHTLPKDDGLTAHVAADGMLFA